MSWQHRPLLRRTNAMADAGLTGGCTTGSHCPSIFKRDQMAAFTFRAGPLPDDA